MNMKPRDEFKQNDDYEMNMAPRPEFKSNEMYGMNMAPKGTNTTDNDDYTLNMDPIYNNYKEEAEERHTGLSR